MRAGAEPVRNALRARAKITRQNARSGSDQCSIPNAQFLSEHSERLAIRDPLRLRIEHWELNIGQILGLMSSSEYCQVIFARFLRSYLPGTEADFLDFLRQSSFIIRNSLSRP